MNQPLEIIPADKADPAVFRSLTAKDAVFLYARYLEQELVFREKRGLDVLLLKSYLRHLFSPDGKIIRLGWDGYGQRLAFQAVFSTKRPPAGSSDDIKESSKEPPLASIYTLVATKLALDLNRKRQHL